MKRRNEKMVIDDIAKELGVSKTTVSRALSGHGRVSGKTRDRILQYTTEIGYTPNAAAKNLATTKTYNIAFSMPLNRDSTRSSYFLECLFGACKEALQTRYDIIVVGEDFDSLRQIIHSRKADGVILSRNIISSAELKQLTQRGVPVVLTGSTSVRDVIQISYDARAAFRDLTMQLMKMWPGEFALLLTKKSYPANITRADGFVDAHMICDREPRLIWNADDEKEIYTAFCELYSQNIRNIVCCDDAVCSTLLSIIKDYPNFDASYHAGRSGHDGINIASFHSSHFLATFHPEIPVVELDPERLGSFACKMLIKKIEGVEVPETTLLDYSLKVCATD
jgi:DNA-binding LacI/PurR family transcriptional regulator